MVRSSEVEGSTMTGPDGSVIGTLEKLLLRSDGTPVVVGGAVRPPASLVVVARAQTYVPLAALHFAKHGVSTTLVKLPKVRESADALGENPDHTIIWTGMPVVGPDGEAAGTVGSFTFDANSGEVTGMVIDAGAVANAAHGMLVVPAEAIVGYSAGAISISRAAGELETTGGAAKAVAEVAARANESMAAAGEAAGNAVVAASGAAGRAIRAAKDAQVAERVAHKAGKTWRDSIDAFKEGMKDG